MKKLCFLSIVAAAVFMLNSVAQAGEDVSITAFQGKATDARDTNADGIAGNDVMGNTTQLLTRNATFPDAKKSWLQFDLTSLYASDSSIQGNLIDAKLTVYGAKSETGAKSYVVNGLNDAANLENWVASALTWNTGPGNNITSGTLLDTSLTTSFYTLSIPVPVLDVMSETPAANRAALTSFLNDDTDGKVTFIITPGSTTYLWNAGQALQPVLTLTYMLGNDLLRAHNPIPADEAVVETSLASLSWTLPEPNAPGGILTCDVYLGSGADPNRLTMNKKTLAAGVSSVAINTANFPTYGALANNQMYYWIVDIHDSTEPNVLMGQRWSFFTNNNDAPLANAGPDQLAWLGKSGIPGQEVISLNGTTSDDGLPGPAYTITWSQISGPAVTISPANVDDTTVTITERGTYVFQLKADDSNRNTTDTVQIIVGTNTCDASHLSTGNPYDAGDQNQDCMVDLQDFAALLSTNWLDCTDTRTDCIN